MKRVAIFPGSFDPFTKGHADIVVRALSLFDEVVIAIGHNTRKTRYFDVQLVMQKIQEAFAKEPKVKVVIYDELTALLADKYGAKYLIRGLRNTTDFEYENSISQVNKSLNPDLETVFLITSPELAHISSTIIREVHRYGGDVSQFLPYSF